MLIPAIQLFGPELTSPLIGGGALPVRDMSAGQIRNAFVLYIGAGAVATGGLVSLAARAADDLSAASARAREPRTRAAARARAHRARSADVARARRLARARRRDCRSRRCSGINALPSALLIVLFGFFFVTVSSRITGEIGSSSNPISGMTVATLLITCLLFVAVGWTGVPYKEMALATAALVCVAASNGGTTSQDLKTGYLVGATPRAQQIAIAGRRRHQRARDRLDAART